MKRPMIPFFGIDRQYQTIRKELAAVTDMILTSGWVMNGSYTEQFERSIAEYERMPRGTQAVAVHSGTQALELAAAHYYKLINEDAADYHDRIYAIIPSLTFVATANAMVRAGFTPIFADVDRNGIIDVSKIDLESIPHPHILVYVGLYGQCYTAEVVKFIQETRTGVIEDAAQHFGSSRPGYPCGALGDYTCLSFDPTKHLSAHGNAGMVITRDNIMANSIRSLRAHDTMLNHGAPGTNSRISEVDAATLSIKFRHFKEWQRRRQEIAEHYIQVLDGNNCRVVCHDTKNVDRHSWQKFVIEVDHRDDLRQFLTDNNIETRVHYEQPVHELEFFRRFKHPGHLSVATSLSRRVLSLPIYPELTDGEVEFIADTVKKRLQKP